MFGIYESIRALTRRYYACYRKKPDDWTCVQFQSYNSANEFFTGHDLTGLYCWVVITHWGIPPTRYLKKE